MPNLVNVGLRAKEPDTITLEAPSMCRSARTGVLLLTVVVAATRVAIAHQPPDIPKAALTDAERERLLAEGEIVRTRDAPGGVTNSDRVTLRLDGYEHDAHVQVIDQRQTQAAMKSGLNIDFRDTYRSNVAAYRLDRRLGLGMVPVTVVRRHGLRDAAFTWWVDDVLIDERDRQQKGLQPPDPVFWDRQMRVVRVFDQLIYNFDRNLGNLLVDKEWRVWMIDHTRAFKIFKEPQNPQELGNQCERNFLAALRRLDRKDLEGHMRGLLSGSQIGGLLARRDYIVKYFDARVERQGEAEVLFDLPSRLSETKEETR
jgi:hypothetical protein